MTDSIKYTETIELVYFKDTGKYYTGGSIEVPRYWITEQGCSTIYSAVRELLRTRNLPGLVQGHSNFNVLVQAPVPHLILGGNEE